MGDPATPISPEEGRVCQLQGSPPENRLPRQDTQANQAAGDTGRAVMPPPAATPPAPDTELMNLVHRLQKEIRELRTTQNSNAKAIRSMVEDTASPLAPDPSLQDVDCECTQRVQHRPEMSTRYPA